MIATAAASSIASFIRTAGGKALATRTNSWTIENHTPFCRDEERPSKDTNSGKPLHNVNNKFSK